MRTIGAAMLTVGVLGLFACAPTPPPAPAAPPTEPAVVETPRPLPLPPPTDHCGAYAMQYLVGRPKTEIPVPIDPARRRVACTTCPVTMDYRQDRLNIFFDAKTGIIREVKCG